MRSRKLKWFYKTITFISAKISKLLLNIINLLDYTHDIIVNLSSKKLWGSTL
jgi:hypothetical protein